MDLTWELDNKHQAMSLCSATSNYINELARKQMDDIADMFPMQNGPLCHSLVRDDYIAFSMTNRYKNNLIMCCGQMKQAEIDAIIPLIEPYQHKSHKELYETLGNEWFSFDKFTYVGPCVENHVSWLDIQQHIVDWLNNHVIEHIINRNKRRVLRAIPEPPKFNMSKISNSLWVLECDETIKQGTAFAFAEDKLITCSHVIGTNTKAFTIKDVTKKYNVEIINQNATLDLAILKLINFQDALEYLEISSADSIVQMNHIGIAGFPNYRLGDTGVIMPGLIVGFRQKSGIRRLLTNAPIIAGNSGGPVLDKNNEVIGVAVTGAEIMEEAGKTEDHGIIPIDAIKFLS